jgi:hypothetical protein
MCEDVLGAGVVHPKGQSSSSKDCNFSSGARYMDITEPDLVRAFACAAKVGTGSTDDPEKPMQAMVNAIAPKGEAPTATSASCAATRSSSSPSSPTRTTTPATARRHGRRLEGLADRRQEGRREALVVLGLFGDHDQPNSICPPLKDNASGAEPSPRLRQFVESFGERGVAGSVCAPATRSSSRGRRHHRLHLRRLRPAADVTYSRRHRGPPGHEGDRPQHCRRPRCSVARPQLEHGAVGELHAHTRWARAPRPPA